MEESQISTPLVWNDVGAAKILVGKILATRSYTRSAIETILRKAWNLQSGFDVTDITGNVFMFNFSDEEDYSRILRGHPWSINGCLLNLLERSRFKSFDEFDFSRGLFWIQLHNVPLEALCLENATRIGSHVGKVIIAEDPFYNGRYLRNFLRARVILDLRKPLAHGYWLPRPDGRKVWIAIKYEKLQSFYYNCGKLGHDNRTCQVEKLMSCYNSSEPRFGSWLSANVCRSWDKTLSVISEDEIEALYVRRKQGEASKRRRETEQQRASRASPSADVDIFSIRIVTLAGDNHGSDLDGERTTVDAIDPGILASTPHGLTLNRDLRDKDVTEGAHCVAENTVIGHQEGNSGLRKVRNRELDSPSDPRAPKAEQASVILPIQGEGKSMALVPYVGSAMKEVIYGLDNLGLKRHAEEDWESNKLKRRKVAIVESSPLSDISNYASSLRKAKAKTRRYGRKRGMVEKEDIIVENEPEDKAVEDSSGYDFVFKAKGNKRKVMSADGNDPIGLDHHALLVDCCFYETKSPKPFWFEANWVQHEEFLQVVKVGWHDIVGEVENNVLDLVRRLEACKKKLVAWSKGAFPNFRSLIEHLRQKLELCNVGPLTEQSVLEAEDLSRQLEKAWAQEERRQRNKILRLKDDNGCWLEEREEINNAFDSFYQKLFTPVGSRPLDQALSEIFRAAGGMGTVEVSSVGICAG
ncbi:hypothetical protein K1719_042236 [Acacia pycnantha]|nr:hypothetical protein K1719_042236 [Acacia pycnantha]